MRGVVTGMTTAVAILSILVLTAPAVSAADDSDVHGLSYREGFTSFSLGVVPGTGTAYPVIDWYVYHIGPVEISVDGEPAETLDVNGLTVLHREYEAGRSYIISFDFGAGDVRTFMVAIRNIITTPDAETGPAGDMMHILATEYERNILMIGLSSGIAAAAAFYLMYRIIRERNKRAVRDI